MNNKQMLFLSIFTLITVLFWIAFDVYHSLKATTIKPVDQKLIKPLEPKFDLETISRLE